MNERVFVGYSDIGMASVCNACRLLANPGTLANVPLEIANAIWAAVSYDFIAVRIVGVNREKPDGHLTPG
jgi:hypothetical protein